MLATRVLQFLLLVHPKLAKLCILGNEALGTPNQKRRLGSHRKRNIMASITLASNGKRILGGWGLVDERSETTSGEESAIPKPDSPNKP